MRTALSEPLGTDFLQAATSQREELVEQIFELTRYAAEIEAEAAEVRQRLAAANRRLVEVNALLGVNSDPIPTAHGLRGQELQAAAVRVIETRAPDRAVHYKEWYDWMGDAGVMVGGRDPLATFLVAIGRAPGIERVGSRTGRYRLNRIADPD